jgi:hypothetical protein
VQPRQLPQRQALRLQLLMLPGQRFGLVPHQKIKVAAKPRYRQKHPSNGKNQVAQEILSLLPTKTVQFSYHWPSRSLHSYPRYAMAAQQKTHATILSHFSLQLEPADKKL